MIKKELYIISSQELLNIYPNLSSNDREREREKYVKNWVIIQYMIYVHQIMIIGNIMVI